MAKEAPNDATLAARARYSQALQRMNELSNNPALEDDYKAARCRRCQSRNGAEGDFLMTDQTTTPTDPFSMTAEQADAQLNAMRLSSDAAATLDVAATPQNAAEKLAALWNDPAWRNRFEAGSSQARQEWEALLDLRRQNITTKDIAEGGPGLAAPLFETVGPGELSTQNKISAAASLREAGIPPAGVVHIIDSLQPGEKSHFTRADVEWARANRDRLMQTQEWVDRLLKGDGQARHQLVALTAILTAGAAE